MVRCGQWGNDGWMKDNRMQMVGCGVIEGLR